MTVPSPHRGVVEHIVAGRADQALTDLRTALAALEGSDSPEALTH